MQLHPSIPIPCGGCTAIACAANGVRLPHTRRTAGNKSTVPVAPGFTTFRAHGEHKLRELQLLGDVQLPCCNKTLPVGSKVLGARVNRGAHATQVTGHTSHCELCSNQGWSATVSVWWWQHKLPPRRRRLGEPPTLPALRNTELVPHGTPRRLYAPRIRKARRQGTTESCAPRHCHKRGQTTQLQITHTAPVHAAAKHLHRSVSIKKGSKAAA